MAPTAFSDIWLGGNDRDNGGQFLWSSALVNPNWKRGEPHNATNEDYIAMGIGWNDVLCSISLQYLCKKSMHL